MKGWLTVTNNQKVLDYLLDDPGHQYLAAEIQKATGISKGGVNLSLRALASRGLVNRQKRGKIYLYSVDHSNPICKQLKVIKSLELIIPLIGKVSGKAERIILFGSAARGEDVKQSDIDVMVVSHHSKEEVEKIIQGLKLHKKLQVIIRDPIAFAEMEKQDPIFFEEVSRGISVWERKE